MKRVVLTVLLVAVSGCAPTMLYKVRRDPRELQPGHRAVPLRGDRGDDQLRVERHSV